MSIAVLTNAVAIISRMNKKYLLAFVAVAGIATGALSYNLSQARINNKPGDEKTAQSASSSEADTRDQLRQQHIKSVASALLSRALILKEPVGQDQQQLDALATDNAENKPYIDPSTNQPYEYNSDQSSLQVGQIYFKVGGSCDNKIRGSNGVGKIITMQDGFIAVNTKLESGEYYCESNL